MLKLLVRGTKWTRFSGELHKMLFSLEYWSWNDIFECNIKKSIVPWRWDKRFFGKKKFSWMKMKKREMNFLSSVIRRRGDFLKIGNLNKFESWYANNEIILRCYSLHHLFSLRFLKNHRKLLQRWISANSSRFTIKVEFLRFAEESKNSLQKSCREIQIRIRSHKIRAQFLLEFFSTNRATNDCFYYPLASAKFSLALCRGNALSGIRTAPSYTRCFPMREILYATS